MCRGIVVDQPVLGEIVGIVSPGVQDANSDAVSVLCGGTGCLFIDPDSLRAAGTTRTRNTARPWDFDGRDVLPLPIESRRPTKSKLFTRSPRQRLTRPARPIASVPVHPRSPQHEGFFAQAPQRGLEMIRIFPCFGLSPY